MKVEDRFCIIINENYSKIIGELLSKSKKLHEIKLNQMTFFRISSESSNKEIVVYQSYSKPQKWSKNPQVDPQIL